MHTATVSSDAVMAKAGVSSAHRVIVVHVSANSRFRRWPAEAFRDAIVALARAGADRRIVVTSGPSEADAARAITAAAQQQLGVLSDRVVQDTDLSIAE